MGGEHYSKMVLQVKDVENTHILLQTVTKWTLQLSQAFYRKKQQKVKQKGVLLNI
jgi:hypothetical protein